MKHTGNSLLRPVLHANPVIRPVIDLFGCRAAVEQTLLLSRDRLREVPQAIPLTALF
jgi:hypothetical protein